MAKWTAGDRYVFEGDVYTVTTDHGDDLGSAKCDDGRSDIWIMFSILDRAVETGGIVRLKRREGAASPSASVLPETWAVGSRYQIGCEIAEVRSLDSFGDFGGRVMAEVERWNGSYRNGEYPVGRTYVWIDEIQTLIETGRAVRLADAGDASVPAWSSGAILEGDSVQGAADADAAANRADAVEDVPDGMFRSARVVGDRFRLGEDPEVFTIETLTAFGDAFATGDRGGEMIVDLRPLDRAISDGSAVLVP